MRLIQRPDVVPKSSRPWGFTQSDFGPWSAQSVTYPSTSAPLVVRLRLSKVLLASVQLFHVTWSPASRSLGEPGMALPLPPDWICTSFAVDHHRRVQGFKPLGRTGRAPLEAPSSPNNTRVTSVSSTMGNHVKRLPREGKSGRDGIPALGVMQRREESGPGRRLPWRTCRRQWLRHPSASRSRHRVRGSSLLTLEEWQGPSIRP